MSTLRKEVVVASTQQDERRFVAQVSQIAMEAWRDYMRSRGWEPYPPEGSDPITEIDLRLYLRG